ncbi:hypothetical protein F5Y06DRAFT_258197 [Hypoxylon sp. FL0890]|nr:hypothetical protein F5Y06DRAFT_258197 [Hypoxylon sp. FL0890]
MSGTTEPSAPDLAQDASGTPSTLPVQKRPRDYGEELKGLPQSDNEDGPDGQNDPSTPALKKQKMKHPGSDDDSDLDDGEIVEWSSSPNRGPAGPAHGQSTAQDVAGRPGQFTARGQIEPNVAARQPSEDGEIDTSMVEASESNMPDEPFVIDKTASRPVQHSGWNQGVSLGARTSFGKPTTQLFPTTASTEAQSALSASFPQGNEAEEAEEAVNEAGHDKGPLPVPAKVHKNSKSKPYLTFTMDEMTWNLPRQTYPVKNNSGSPKVFWESKIREWTHAFIRANASMVDDLNVDIIRAAFSDHVTRKEQRLLLGDEEMVKTLQDDAPRALARTKIGHVLRKVREKLQNRENKMLLAKREEEDIALSKESSREGVQKDAISLEQNTAGGLEVSSLPISTEEAPNSPLSDEEEELRLQQRYFPGAAEPSRYCINCSGVGHRARECPQLQCKFCGSREHILFACPSRQRCLRCHQIGHKAESCMETLALTNEELGGCAICGADHSEGQCSEIWRSFTPSTEVNKKVKDIPAFCYTCGSVGHYGPECGLPERSRRVRGRTTWSEANRLLYVDKESTDLAIAWAEVDLTRLYHDNFNTLRRSKRQVHTHFISSDESEEDLVHAPVKKPEPRGEIRISSNIASFEQEATRNGRARRNNDQSRRRQNERDFSPPPPPPTDLNAQGNGASSWQPPLPPGPPPPLGNHSVRRLEPPPPASLPPRPPASNSGAGRGAATNRSGQNSRGGRGGSYGSSRGNGRGGGRGRGRGRGK